MKTLPLLFSVLTLTGSVPAENKPAPEIIRFGLIADIQYADAEPRIGRFYRNALPKLKSCVDDLNAEKVEFTVNLGDLVDRDTPKNLPPVLECLAGLTAPLYNITGNHDYQGVTDNAALYRRLGMPASYYSVSRSNWCFIFLNTNEIASYANIEGSPKEAELKTLRERIKAEKRKNGASYNGGIGKEQTVWLRTQLTDAQEKNRSVLIFSHHPLGAATGLTALDDVETLKLLSEFPCVKAVISGHHHSGAFGICNGIPCITTEGMVETEKETAYGIVELSPDALKLIGKGRTRTHEISFSRPDKRP